MSPVLENNHRVRLLDWEEVGHRHLLYAARHYREEHGDFGFARYPLTRSENERQVVLADPNLSLADALATGWITRWASGERSAFAAEGISELADHDLQVVAGLGGERRCRPDPRSRPAALAEDDREATEHLVLDHNISTFRSVAAQGARGIEPLARHGTRLARPPGAVGELRGLVPELELDPASW